MKILASFIVATSLLVWTSPLANAAAPTEASAKMVSVEIVRQGTMTQTARLIGQYKARNEAILAAQIEGTIAHLLVSPGSSVKKGKL